MSLLPKCPSRFDKATFWDSAYKSTDKAFEWYAEFHEVLPLFLKYFRLSDRVLNIGCGNSDLGVTMLSSGCERVTNIDISETVVKKMKNQYPDQDYQQMDATHMTFKDNSFDAAVDKGTIDALLPNSAALSEGQGAEVVKRLILETLRVLKPMARFLIISLAQKQVVETLRLCFEQFAPCNCIVRAHYLPPQSDKPITFALPVFVFVVMKMKMNRSKPIYELQSRPGSNFDSSARCSDGVSWAAGILAHQVVQFNIRTANSRFPPEVRPSEHFDVLLELDDSKGQIGGFRLFVVDKPGPAAIKFAVFVVPCGREIEDLYSTCDGRNNLADAVSVGRLIVCVVIPKRLSKDQSNNNQMLTLSGVTALLNEAVVDLAPPTFTGGTDSAPYLTEADSGSPNQQKLGSLFIRAESKLLRVVEVETNVMGDCRNLSSKRKAKKKSTVEVESRQFKQLTEAESGHLSCIAQCCSSHVTSSKWSCQQLPSNCELRQLLSNVDNKNELVSVLQIGDDSGQLLDKVKCSSLSLKDWHTFCIQEEIVPEMVRNEIKQVDRSGCKMVSTIEELFVSFKPDGARRRDLVIVVVSCAFIRSIELFAENASHLFAEDSHLVLVRCCREPTKDLVRLENQLRIEYSNKNKNSNAIELDITETIGEWSAITDEKDTS